MKQVFLWVGCMALCLLFVGGASALSFDQNVVPDVVFGTGNGNGFFTVDRSNGVELGLRGKIRFQGDYNSNGAGIYSFDLGTSVNFEWSINTDYDFPITTTGWNLDDLVYKLGVDQDSSLATSFLTFDPINSNNPNTGTLLWDHGIGNNLTENGAGDDDVGRTVASYTALIAGNNVAQNSWRLVWYGIDTSIDGTYDFYLTACDTNGNELASTNMQIVIGAGGDPVPEPATLALVGSGAAALLARRRRRV